MVSELKGNNGKIMRSEDYFKKINQKVLVGELMKNKMKWDYYKVLGGTPTKLDANLKGANRSAIKSSLNFIAKTIKNDLSSARQGQQYVLSKNRKNIKEALDQLTKCKIVGLSALNTMLMKLAILEDFHGKPIIIDPKYSSGNPVNVKLEYKGDITYLHIEANVFYMGWDFSNIFLSMEMGEFNSRKEKVKEGIEKWAGEYQVFGNQKIRVYVNVVEKDTAITVGTGTIGAIKINLIKNIDFANSLGGDRLLGWKPKSMKMMNIGWDDVDIYKHEFGHSLGLGDAYSHLWFKKIYELHGVNPSLYEDLDKYPKNADGSIDMVMNNNGPVRDNDIEMVLLAFSTGKRQNYQKESDDIWKYLTGTGEISEALGRGN